MRRITSVIARPISGSAIGSAERDDRGAGDDGEADVGVGAGVVAVGDQRRAVEPPPGAACGCGRRPSYRRSRARPPAPARPGARARAGRSAAGSTRTPATQALTKIAATTSRPAQRSARALRSANAIAERDGGRGVAEVVDQVGEQRDAAGRDEHGGLRERGEREHEQRQPTAVSPARERLIDGSIRPWLWECDAWLTTAPGRPSHGPRARGGCAPRPAGRPRAPSCRR